MRACVLIPVLVLICATVARAEDGRLSFKDAVEQIIGRNTDIATQKAQVSGGNGCAEYSGT